MTKLEKLKAKQKKMILGLGFADDWVKNPQNVVWEDELDMRWISRCERAGNAKWGGNYPDTTNNKPYCIYCNQPESNCACDECRFCDWCDKPNINLVEAKQIHFAVRLSSTNNYCNCWSIYNIQQEIEKEESK